MNKKILITLAFILLFFGPVHSQANLKLISAEEMGSARIGHPHVHFELVIKNTGDPANALYSTVVFENDSTIARAETKNGELIGEIGPGAVRGENGKKIWPGENKTYVLTSVKDPSVLESTGKKEIVIIIDPNDEINETNESDNTIIEYINVFKQKEQKETKHIKVSCEGHAEYETIQEAINAAGNGDTIVVQPCAYTENIIINKSLTLRGDLVGKQKALINGCTENEEQKNQAVTITGKSVTLEGFNITNCREEGRERNGILVKGDFARIKNNFIHSTDTAIIVIQEEGEEHLISTIKNNTLIKNHGGIELLGTNLRTFSSGTNIDKNLILETKGDAITLRDVSHNIIMDNYIQDVNGTGMLLVLSPQNTIIRNTIKNCRGAGIRVAELASGRGINWIYHNNLIDSNPNAADQRENDWNYTEGNYWDDYNGTDENNDGIGDTPYEIIGGNSMDYKPLMEPYGEMGTPLLERRAEGCQGKYFSKDEIPDLMNNAGECSQNCDFIEYFYDEKEKTCYWAYAGHSEGKCLWARSALCEKTNCKPSGCEVKITDDGKPLIEWARATPPTIKKGSRTVVGLEVKLSPETKADKVYVNLGPLGLTKKVELEYDIISFLIPFVPPKMTRHVYGWTRVYDDGKTYGDHTAGDNIYTFVFTSPKNLRKATYGLDVKAINKEGEDNGSPILFEVGTGECYKNEDCKADEVCINQKCEKAQLVIGFCGEKKYEPGARRQYDFFMEEFIPHTGLNKCPERVRFLFKKPNRWNILDPAMDLKLKSDYAVVIGKDLLMNIQDVAGSGVCGYCLPLISGNSVTIDPECIGMLHLSTHELGHKMVGLKDQYCTGDPGKCGFKAKPNPLKSELGCLKEDYDGDGVEDCCNKDCELPWSYEMFGCYCCDGNVGHSEAELAEKAYETKIYEKMAELNEMGEAKHTDASLINEKIDTGKKLTEKEKTGVIMNMFPWNKYLSYEEAKQKLQEMRNLLSEVENTGFELKNLKENNKRQKATGEPIPVLIEKIDECIQTTDNIEDLEECYKQHSIEMPSSWSMNEQMRGIYLEDGKLTPDHVFDTTTSLDIQFETRSIMGGSGNKKEFDKRETEIISKLKLNCGRR